MTNDAVRRYVRYQVPGAISYGLLEGDRIRELDRAPFLGGRPTGYDVPLDDVKLLTPVDPARITKVISVEDAYVAPGGPRPWAPHPFLVPKMQTSLITDGGEIEIPPESHNAVHGGSMVLVIGARGKELSIEEAASVVFGVAVGNDVNEPAWLDRAPGFLVPDRVVAKGSDTWGPIGTQIVTGLDFGHLDLETRVNGEVAASGNTSMMVTNVARLVHYISHYMTLLPGDLIFTGSPRANEGMAQIKPGDTVEVTLEGAGMVRNRVVAMPETGIDPWWETIADKMRSSGYVPTPMGGGA